MKTEWIVIVGLLLVIGIGAVFWMNDVPVGTVNNGHGNIVTPPANNSNGGGNHGGGTITPPVDNFPPIPPETTYEFGAKFEPPVGRIVHGMGQWEEYNTKYLKILPADDYPASELMFIQIGDSKRPWDPAKIKEQLMKIDAAGMIPSLNISLQGNQLTQAEITAGGDPYYGIDNDVANGTKYDSRLLDLVKIAKDYKKPFMIRIGGEFNGWWNGYEPYEYPKAFRKIVQMYRDAGVDNVAFIWCYEVAAPDDYMEKNTAGEYKWFPGDDVIDWYSIDVFGNNDISGPEKIINGVPTNYGKTVGFLELAKAHKKPVVIAESGSAFVGITSDVADGKADWDAWFKPYFQLMQDYPVIKWFHFVSYDWTKASYYSSTGWKNSDITINSYITQQWVDEMNMPTFLHSDERYLLKNYLDYK